MNKSLFVIVFGLSIGMLQLAASAAEDTSIMQIIKRQKQFEYGLKEAIDVGDLSWIQKYLAAGGDPDIFLSPNEYSYHYFMKGRAVCPLQRALVGDASNKVELVTAFINARAQIDMSNFLGESSLHLATLCRQPALVSLLLERGANWTRTCVEGKMAEQRIKGFSPEAVSMRILYADHKQKQVVAYSDFLNKEIEETALFHPGVESLIADYAMPLRREMTEYDMMRAVRVAERAVKRAQQ